MILLGLGVAVAVCKNAWLRHFQQKREIHQLEQKLDTLQSDRAKLIKEETRLKSDVYRETKAQERGWIHPSTPLAKGF